MIDTIKLADNAMLKHKPELIEEWDFIKNSELGLDIYKITKGAHKKAWWNCLKCHSNYDAMIYDKTNGSGCPYCHGTRVNKTNSLYGVNPKLALDLHPTLNQKTSNTIHVGSNSKHWWLGRRCGHEWYAQVAHRNIGVGCPYCTNRKVLVGFNDFNTTHPELAKYLVDYEDGFKHTYGRSKKLQWKCQEYSDTVVKSLEQVSMSRLILCSGCSDKTSLGETIMFNVLQFNNLDFTKEKMFPWSGKKKYDFYIPSISTIIEIHGMQHYQESTGNRAKSIRDEQENDRLKRQLALENGIEHYIEIDARHSEFDYIKSNIIADETLNKLLDFNLVDWKNFKFPSVKKYMIDKINKEWNNGIKDIPELSERLDICKSTITKYLKIGGNMGLSDYSLENFQTLRGDKLYKPIAKLDLSGNIVEEFKSISAACKKYNINKKGSIWACCNRFIESVDGNIWRYKGDN